MQKSKSKILGNEMKGGYSGLYSGCQQLRRRSIGYGALLVQVSLWSVVRSDIIVRIIRHKYELALPGRHHQKRLTIGCHFLRTEW